MKVLFYTAFVALFAFTSAFSVQSQQDNLRDAELSDKPLCKVCENLVQGAVDLLKKNETEVEIEDLATKVCNVMTGVFKTECNYLVNTYGKEILEHLTTTVDPAAVCSTIKLCSVQIETEPEPIVLPAGEGDSVVCSVCQFILKEIKTKVNDKTTKEEIENIVKKVCEIIPSETKEDCDKLIDEYADKIIQWINEGDDPDKICTSLKLC